MSESTISLWPRLDVGLAPYVDGWRLRRRIVESMASDRSNRARISRAAFGEQASNSRVTAGRILKLLLRGWQSGTAPLSAAIGIMRTLVGSGRCLRMVALPAAVLVIAPPILAVARLAEVKSTYGQIIADRSAIKVRIGAHFVGAMRRPGTEPDALVFPTQIRSDSDLVRMYEATEGGGDRLSYFGLPLRSMARAALCHVGVPIPGSCGGASGELQHAIRGLRGGFGGDKSWLRKAHEFLDAPALAVAYPKGAARNALILDNINLGYLPGGRPIVGVSNASLALWGEVNPDKISLARQAAIWGIFKYPLTWDDGRGLSDKGIEARNHALNRARDVLVKTFGGNDLRVIGAIKELEEPGFLPLRPVAPVVELDGAVGTLLAAELDNINQSASGPITDVNVTIPDTETLHQYQSSIASTLRTMEESGDFARPLLTGGDDRADGLAVMTRPDGAITAIAATTPRFGLATPRRAGSHGKWAILLAMAGSGRFTPSSMLCDRALDGIQNAGGDTGVAGCAHGRGLVPLTAAFGKSLNLPLLDAARSLNGAELEAAAKATGFALPTGERDPRRSLILGNAEAAPASIIAFGNALSSFANGGPPIGSYPYLIRRVRIAGVWVTPTQRPRLDLRRFLHGKQARRLVMAVCAAPLDGGTLKALHTSTANSGVQCGKSATVAATKSEGYQTISKATVVSCVTGTWYAYLGAPRGVLGSSKLSIMPFAQAAGRSPPGR